MTIPNRIETRLLRAVMEAMNAEELYAYLMSHSECRLRG